MVVEAQPRLDALDKMMINEYALILSTNSEKVVQAVLLKSC